jgi:Dynein heavy chain, N-terminal region 1.
MESQQLRKENDSSGPQDELEYWKRRGAQFSQIVRHLQAHEVSLIYILIIIIIQFTQLWVISNVASSIALV